MGDATEEDLNGRVIDALLPLHLKYKIDDQLIDEEEMEVTSICIKLGQMVFEGILLYILSYVTSGSNMY